MNDDTGSSPSNKCPQEGGVATLTVISESLSGRVVLMTNILEFKKKRDSLETFRQRGLALDGSVATETCNGMTETLSV